MCTFLYFSIPHLNVSHIYNVSLMLCLQLVGRPAGLCGLQNHGNSCYLNTAVQCLAHTAPLKHLFVSNAYKADLREEAVLGTQPQVTQAFAAVVQSLWQVRQHYCSPVWCCDACQCHAVMHVRGML